MTKPQKKMTKKEAALWHDSWIDEEGFLAIVRLNKKMQKQCEHIKKKLIYRRPGGWNVVCCLCGKRFQNRRQRNAPTIQTGL